MEMGQSEGMNTRISFLAALAALIGLPLQAAPISLSDLSAYFAGISTAEAPFTQYNADGSELTGRLIMHRPGRARFEYDDSDILVVVGGGQVAIFEDLADAEPLQYPLGMTPLDLILGRNVDLAASALVVDHIEAADGTTRVVAWDENRPEAGELTLVFADEPVRLVQWMTRNDMGETVVVALGDFTFGATYSNFLFSPTFEADQRSR